MLSESKLIKNYNPEEIGHEHVKKSRTIFFSVKAIQLFISHL